MAHAHFDHYAAPASVRVNEAKEVQVSVGPFWLAMTVDEARTLAAHIGRAVEIAEASA